MIDPHVVHFVTVRRYPRLWTYDSLGCLCHQAESFYNSFMVVSGVSSFPSVSDQKCLCSLQQLLLEGFRKEVPVWEFLVSLPGSTSL